MVNTVQLGLRIEKDLLKEIEDLSEAEGVDKMAWIRRALADFASQERDKMTSEAVKDYITLAIDEKFLKDVSGWMKIPKDIEDARKEVLAKIIKEGLEK